MNLNNILLKMLWLILPLFSSAEEPNIWIKSPYTNLNEFKAHVQSLGPPHKSYAEKQLEQTRDSAKSFQLKNRLLKAQEFYLSGQGDRAFKAFQEITELALQADWEQEDRRIILYSFLRMAQSEEDLEKRKALLLSAGSFASFQVSEDSYPDYNLFPPPLMEELRAIQQKTNKLWVDWKGIFPEHEIILINGKQVEKHNKEQIPQALYRVTALSSSHQSWSQKLNLSELLTQTVKTTSMTKGNCENPYLSADNPANNMIVLSSSHCPKQKILKLSKTPAPEKKPFIKNVMDKNFSLEEPEQTVSLMDFKNLETQKLSKMFDLSQLPPWLIVGIGAVSLSLVISLSYSSYQRDNRGTHTY